jgi:tetratricopeptide (TPR) repeat protein
MLSCIPKRSLLRPVLNGFVLIALVVSAFAQAQDPERRRAFELYDANNMTAALPLLEKLATANPNDVAVLSRLGFALYAGSSTEKDPAARNRLRQRARDALLRARSLGDNSNLTNMALDALDSPDSTNVPFSRIQAAEAAIREGEAAFVRGDMDQAIAAYKRALEIDPRLYDAALYAGDAEFKKAHNSSDPTFRNDHFNASGIWFAKAISINANRETAYRYWGDALDAQGKMVEARDKFVEAIIADPYNRNTYVGLTQWAQRHKAQLGHPKIEPPNGATAANSADGSSNWAAYTTTRAAWLKTEFFKNYPAEKVYRHSLKEEASALSSVAAACARDLQSGKVKTLEPSLTILVKLAQDGFLEAYVLFARPDEGIAQDYAAYRAAYREKLKQYWLNVVIIPAK